MQIRTINAQMAVSPQIEPSDVPAIAERGYRAIINNRPDGEDVGQPDGDAIRAAAEAAGLAYAEIPVTHAGFSLPQVDAMRAARAAAGGPVLAYCRSGTRSCHLWGLSAAREGVAVDEIVAAAASAGYDLEPLRPLLDQLSHAG